MSLRNYLKKNIIITVVVCLVIFFSAIILTFLYLSGTFRSDPVVSVRADNTYEKTLHIVTDSDYEPFSYIGSSGEYLGMDVELITEIANRLRMNLDLKLMDWTAANEIFHDNKADAFLNMETDSVADDSRLISTLPTIEKQYVVYGREAVSSVPELYGRKVASLHQLPELGLGDGITYLNSYAEIFEALKNGEYEFAICPIQVGNVFLQKMAMTDIKPSYAVGHIYGAITLHAENTELKRRMDAVISDMQKEGIISALDQKWISNRYQNMTLKDMIKSYPEILTAFIAILLFIVFLILYLMLQNRNMRDKDAYSKALHEKIEVITRQNEELVIAREKAKESSRAKTEFLANMSHEIRTPINAVLGMNEMIIRESRDERITLYARNVESAGKNLLSIINDILDFSKIEAGKMKISNADYKLSSVLNDVTNMIAFKARAKDLNFKVDVDKSLPDGLHGDEIRVRQVITNILNNAVKYTNEGSIIFRVSGSRKNDEQGQMLELVIQVIDTGIGIKQEDLPKLFKKFERVDLVQNSTVEGTGLGLSITQNLLQLMGGDIQVQSEYGKGSTFTLRIPQLIINGESIGDFQKKFEQSVHEIKAYRESFRAPEAKILVVDDTEMNLTVIKGLLSQTEIQIDTALSGINALTLTKNTLYDIILMDQRMPQMDGTETMNRIRQQTDGANQNTAVICLTADAVSGARAKYLAEGFTDYLSKPVESAALEATLIKYLPASKVILQKISADNREKDPDQKTELEKFYDSAGGLNYADAVRFCSNEEILQKTLEQFYHSITSNAEAIESFLNNGDYKNYTIKVHALKSSARLIGAMELSEEAKYLEECGNKIDVEQITEKTPKLLQDYREYLTKLAPLYAAEEEARAAAPEISPDMLKEAYEAISELSSSFDIDSIDGIVAEVRKYRLPESETARFAEVDEAVRNMDWDRLEKALKK